MRTQEEIERALDKLQNQYSAHPSNKLKRIIEEINYYYKNPIMLNLKFRWPAVFSDLYIDWMNGKRNKISKLLKRIKI